MSSFHFNRRVALAVLAFSCSVAAQAEMTFFVTSTGMGKGADLGGLAGADAHCQQLAEAVGAGGHTWRAYLSASAADGQPAVHARERIGKGPWRNAKGVVVASDVVQLHGDNNLNKDTALDEHGMPVKGRGDQPNMHDILTGSKADGTAFVGDEDLTCANWTSSTTGAAMVGHHDRVGLDDSAPARSWNTSHPTRGGCSNEALASSGGAGLFYCFAAD
ncbi:hypothetical protein SAMN05216201_1077 [Pseudomonas linyingensis]|uniref:Collagenase NC10 and Endostatin n=1 Tax=Pseudomonas linyingensis TaxID=915471 RepID=A0A1H6XXH6_9PSED|nr:hypothetical protein [Pseudomonas linyingensis]SEJ31487.1 hypothetical protein SAMN05216201_1077 [Pseudomonas linyingensis]